MAIMSGGLGLGGFRSRDLSVRDREGDNTLEELISICLKHENELIPSCYLFMLLDSFFCVSSR